VQEIVIADPSKRIGGFTMPSEALRGQDQGMMAQRGSLGKSKLVLKSRVLSALRQYFYSHSPIEDVIECFRSSKS
jgi:hypothetical protein